MNKYWQTRMMKNREKLLDKSILSLEKLVKEIYLNASASIIKDLKEVYITILLEDEPLLSHLYEYNRYYELLNKVNSKLRQLGLEEDELFNDKLKELYIRNRELIGDTKVIINEQQLENAIKEIWVDDGLSFSDRIWKDKSALVEELNKCLIDGIASGQSQDSLIKDFMSRFSVSYNEARRLIRTEMAHTAIKSTVDTYKADGISYYRFLATPDEKTCQQCQELDGKIFPITDVEHLPPLHPNDRCSILAADKLNAY